MKQKKISYVTPIRCLSIAILFLFLVAIFLGNLGSPKTSSPSDVDLNSMKKPSVVNNYLPRQVGNPSLREFKIENPKLEAPSQKKTIAYAITVTKDGNFVDGALVLGYAAQKVHDASKGNLGTYDVALIAFVTANVITARPILKRFGWKILEKPLPVALDEIENKEYADRMKDSGCCGADEFLKLWAYTLTEYHRVVHLDMDSIIYKNMDELYHLDKEMLYTGDYNMKAGSPVAPAQGGFLVIRPSLERFQEYQAIIRKGDHRKGGGWAGTRIGNFWGGTTIQGIIPYFYHHVHKGDAMELNRCVYNCMVDNPYKINTQICHDGKPTCEDCRLQVIENVSSAHFTICQKPWTCTYHVNPKNKDLCLQLHLKWFELRDEFEMSRNIDRSYRDMHSKFKGSKGMCKGYGDSKYIPIPIAS